MAVAVIMPRQGNTVESCIITKWAKQKGDAVKVGDILFSYETDKAPLTRKPRSKARFWMSFSRKGTTFPA